MVNHTPLSPDLHRDLRIKFERSYELGDDMMSCITFPEEFRNVQNHYPILFQLSTDRDEFRAVVLFGFMTGENLFVRDENWDAAYLPLAVDIQPFLVGMPRKPDGEKKIHIDMDSPRIGKDDGMRVFNDVGVATDYLQTISTKLATLHEGYQNSASYLAALQKYDLLEPMSVDIELNDGSKHKLVGFHVINEDKLSALHAKDLGELNTAGYLMPTFMALASLSNMSALVARKNALLKDV